MSDEKRQQKLRSGTGAYINFSRTVGYLDYKVLAVVSRLEVGARVGIHSVLCIMQENPFWANESSRFEPSDQVSVN